MRLVEEALFLWRDAEQLLSDMPPTHPERTEVAWIAHELRRLTSQLSRVEALPATTAANRQSLAELRARLMGLSSNANPEATRRLRTPETDVTPASSAA